MDLEFFCYSVSQQAKEAQLMAIRSPLAPLPASPAKPHRHLSLAHARDSHPFEVASDTVLAFLRNARHGSAASGEIRENASFQSVLSALAFHFCPSRCGFSLGELIFMMTDSGAIR